MAQWGPLSSMLFLLVRRYRFALLSVPISSASIRSPGLGLGGKR